MTQETNVKQQVSARPEITLADHESGEYKWNNNRCKVLLFQFNTSRDASRNCYERKPEEEEIKHLKQCFQSLLGSVEMDFMYHRNQAASLLAEIVGQAIEDDEKNKKYDCFIFIFLTFGKDDKIFCNDGEIPIENILDPIKKKQSMALKPKIILIQSDDDHLKDVNLITKGGGDQPGVRSVPQEADIFIMRSIIPELHFPVNQYVSECIFVTALKQTVEEAKKAQQKLDIHQLSLGINAKVNARLEERSNLGRLPIPEVISTLTKALCFPCGLEM